MVTKDKIADILEKYEQRFHLLSGELFAELKALHSPTLPDQAEAIPGDLQVSVHEIVSALDLEPIAPEPPTPRPKLLQRPEWELISREDARWGKTVAWIITGGATEAQLNAMQQERQVRFEENDREHLLDLAWWRAEFGKAWSLAGILKQPKTTPDEAKLWEALGNKMNVK